MDAISDLAAMALKYFSEDREVGTLERLKAAISTSEAVTAVATEFSNIWDETGSAAYTLTRMANLVDEREASGDYTPLARVVRALASNSLQRNVHMSVAASFDSDELYEYEELGSRDFLYKSNPVQASLDREAWEIEELYRGGEGGEADSRVLEWIKTRWLASGLKEDDKLLIAFTDINESGARGHHALFTAFIRLGQGNSQLLSFAPEAKAEIAENLMNATDARFSPAVMKWLLTVDTYREDQMNLLNLLEKAAERSLKSGRRNSITELFAELRQVPQEDDEVRVAEVYEEEEQAESDDDELDGYDDESSETPVEKELFIEEETNNEVGKDEKKIEADEKEKKEIENEKKDNKTTEEKKVVPLELDEENQPIRKQDTSDDAGDSGLTFWYFLLAFIFIGTMVIALLGVAYYLKNFHYDDLSQVRI